MIRFFVIASLLVAVLFCAAPLPCLAADHACQSAASEDGFISMFNGKDFTGWKCPDMSYWSIQDGVIVGETTKDHPAKKALYLWWTEKQATDFVFTCKFKITGKGGNSGIQFRSEVIDGGVNMMGPQADMQYGPAWTGCLYHPKRFIYVKRGEKGTITADGEKKLEQFADGKELLKVVKFDEWNTYKIIAKGTKVTLKINGKLMSQVDDLDKKFPPEAGYIGVQLHPGPAMKIEYKDLKVKIEK